MPVADEVELVLGDGAIVALPRRRAGPGVPPAARRTAAPARRAPRRRTRRCAGPIDGVRACFRCPECTIKVRADDDLLLVAGMRVSQRARLIDAGHHHHRRRWRAHHGPVPDLPARTVAALTAQARLQVAPRERQDRRYEVADAAAADAAARRRPGRPVLRLRGRPAVDRRRPRAGAWSTCWACSTRATSFTPLWAHDRAEERQALVDFLAMVRKRRKRYPSMHIYHYAAYEKTHAAAAGRPLRRRRGRRRRPAAQRRAGRPFPVGAQEHSGRHRELQPQVARAAVHGRRAAHRRGHHRRRLDHAVRPLLRTARRRPEPTRRRCVLKEIEDYNRYDCRSTRRLRDWLLARAIESGVPPTRPAAGGATARAARGRRRPRAHVC